MATVGIVIAALVGLVALGRSTWKIVKNVHSWANRMERFAEYLDGELRHNGGDSLRDEVCRQGKVLDTLAELFEARGVVIEEIRDALTAHDERLVHVEEGVDSHVRPQVDEIHGAVITGEHPTIEHEE